MYLPQRRQFHTNYNGVNTTGEVEEKFLEWFVVYQVSNLSGKNGSRDVMSSKYFARTPLSDCIDNLRIKVLL